MSMTRRDFENFSFLAVFINHTETIQWLTEAALYWVPPSLKNPVLSPVFYSQIHTYGPLVDWTLAFVAHD